LRQERNDVLPVLGRQHLPHFRRSLAREHPLGEAEALELAAEVIFAPLHGHHLHTRVLQRTGPVAFKDLLGLVRDELVLDIKHGDVLPVVREQH